MCAAHIVITGAAGEVRLYREKVLLSVHSLPSPVTGMWFGRYGREDNTLITVTKSGALDIRILPRTAAALDAPSVPVGPPPEQDIPLQVRGCCRHCCCCYCCCLWWQHCCC